MNFKKQLLAVAVSTLVASSAWATNGYAPHGVGQKSKGMGGAGVAFTQDTLAGGVNPAGMVHQGNKFEVGMEWFKPQRSATFMGTEMSANKKTNFLVPELGYNRMAGDNMSYGVSVFGNGGMDTSYYQNIFGAGGNTGISLLQAFIVPTVSWKLNENHSFGVGLNLAVQAFKANGLEPFGVANTGSGFDYAYGAGVRLGWMGKVSDTVTLGATYQTRTYMTEFDDYSDLFAEQGDFDIPANFAIGIAVAATPKLTVAFDVMRIQYSDVNALGNIQTEGGPLGADNGAGFGWEDQTVYKLGFNYQYNNKLTLRAGVNHGSSPIPASQTMFNTLAPATVEDHLTLGATWKLNNGMEVTASYMHAFEEKITGVGGAVADYDIEMYQDSIGVSVSWDL